MTDAGITLLIFLVAVVLFVVDVLPMGLLVFSVPVALYFSGIIEAKEIFAPLVGQSIILVVAMSVIGAALFKTGMAERIGAWLFRFCPGERSLILAVTLFSGTVSGFVSNTGTVAVLIPIVMGVAAAHRIKPSRLLIPLTAGATIGGNISVIGSPGNLIAKETIERFSEGTMSVTFFEYAKIGVPFLIAAAAFLALIGPKVIPAHESPEAEKYASKGCGGIDWRRWFTLATLIATVAAMIAADYIKALPPMHITACVGAMAVVLFRVISQKEAFAAFDMQAVFLLSFMTPLGAAMMKTGAAERISHAVISVADGHGPILLMAIPWQHRHMRAVLPDRLEHREDAGSRSARRSHRCADRFVGRGLHSARDPGQLDDSRAGQPPVQGFPQARARAKRSGVHPVDDPAAGALPLLQIGYDNEHAQNRSDSGRRHRPGSDRGRHKGAQRRRRQGRIVRIRVYAFPLGMRILPEDGAHDAGGRFGYAQRV